MAISGGIYEPSILQVIRDRGTWIWSIDLVMAVFPAASPITKSQSRIISRTARGLVKSGLLCSGMADYPGGSGFESFRLAYWLPNQLAPKLRQMLAAADVKAAILRCIERSGDPMSYPEVLRQAVRLLNLGELERNRLRLTAHRALSILMEEGVVRKVQDEGFDVRKTYYIATRKKPVEV